VIVVTVFPQNLFSREILIKKFSSSSTGWFVLQLMQRVLTENLHNTCDCKNLCFFKSSNMKREGSLSLVSINPKCSAKAVTFKFLFIFYYIDK